MQVLIIGCGKMGGALLSQWARGHDGNKEGGHATVFTVIDPFAPAVPEGVTLLKNDSTVGDRLFDIIVIAIKPQMIEEVLPAHVGRLAPGGFFLSIAAGFSIGRLAGLSGGKPVIRVMPNLPAAIGQGVSGLCPSADATEAMCASAEALMRLAGTVVRVPDEDSLDRLTAVAGSGPGYVFELARSYVSAANALGFSPEVARELVLQTLAGSIAMAQGSDLSLEELRNSVTSKNGTTEAGLKALNADGGLDERLSATVNAAYARAIELR